MPRRRREPTERTALEQRMDAAIATRRQLERDGVDLQTVPLVCCWCGAMADLEPSRQKGTVPGMQADSLSALLCWDHLRLWWEAFAQARGCTVEGMTARAGQTEVTLRVTDPWQVQRALKRGKGEG